MKLSPSISIIMPSLNEENNIENTIIDTITALDKEGMTGEIIIVNDGSTDKTGEIAERLSKTDSRISVIRHTSPLGIGRSFMDGVLKAKHDSVVMYPGDNEMLPGEMLLYLDELRSVDIIVPYIVNTASRSVLRRMISGAYSLFVRFAFNLNVHHSNGTVVYRRCILNGIKLRSNGFLYQTELLAKTIHRGYLYAEVPYFIRPRMAGKSKSSSLKGVVGVIIQLGALAMDIYFSNTEAGIAPDSATANRKLRVEALLANKERVPYTEVEK